MRLGTIQEFSVTIPEPFDFRLTVAKPAGWHWSTRSETFEDGVFRTGLRVGDVPVGLAMNAWKNKVRIRAFSEDPLGKNNTGELREIVRHGLGGDEDLTGFYAFAADDPVLAKAVGDHPGMRIGLVDDIFGSVTLAILLQMAPINRSEQMMDALLTLAGTGIQFDGHAVTLWPRAEDVASLDPRILRKDAKLGYRAERLVAAAKYLEGHPISLRDLAKIPEEEAMKTLIAIPGIGKYSAAIIFGQSTPPIDAWSVVIMSELYDHKTPKNSRQEIERIQKDLSARWGKWSWLAFAYILNDLENLSKIYSLSRLE